ncbi:MAG: tripartite tricarboxylate transporter TctB family protein [Hyphomicrobiaceae bacterium]|nr:tripartite tricarboxylate transporter TctB family protein [Hyphomicrobiaceae bacterium]
MEIVLAAVLMLIGAIAIYDSVNIGFGWRDDGPAPGFFPFWVGLTLVGSSLINLFQGIRKSSARETFVTKPQFGRVLAVLIPSILYVAAIGGLNLGPIQIPGLGIYLASAIFIALFMIFIGKESVIKAILVGCFVPLVTFFMFEKWFLVPLPKGPIEAALGLA